MPELPEVEAVCRKVRAEAVGARILQARFARESVTRPQSAASVEAAVTGRTVEAVERRGKNILLRLSGGVVLHVHLRMTGNLYVVPGVQFRAATARAWFELDGGRGLIFEDSRVLGKIHAYEAAAMEAVLSGVGIEPLSDEFTSDWLIRSAGRSRKPAKLFLMDQGVIAGLGNIYAAEALFRAKVHPGRVMSSLRQAKIAGLWKAIREVMTEAVDSAVFAYADPGRFAEGEAFACAVYDREGQACLRCGKKVKRMAQGGRSTYYCGGCQR